MRDDYGSVRIDIPCSPLERVGPEPTFAEREKAMKQGVEDVLSATRKMYLDSYFPPRSGPGLIERLSNLEYKQAQIEVAMRSEGAD